MLFVSDILEKVLCQENKVLEHWTQRKKRLDQCQQYVLFERSAKQAIEWIHDTGEIYLSTHTNVGQNKEETETLLLEHNVFKGTAKVLHISLIMCECLIEFCISSMLVKDVGIFITGNFIIHTVCQYHYGVQIKGCWEGQDMWHAEVDGKCVQSFGQKT
jgi:hypothetical protein